MRTEDGSSECQRHPHTSKPTRARLIASDPNLATPDPVPLPDPGPEPVDPVVAAARTAGGVLGALEKRHDEISKQPVIEQPLTALSAEYQKLLDEGALGPGDMALVSARLEMLAARTELRDSLAEIASTRQALAISAKARQDAAAARPKLH